MVGSGTNQRDLFFSAFLSFTALPFAVVHRYGQFRISSYGCRISSVRMKGIDVKGRPRFPFPVVDCHHQDHTSITTITIFAVAPTPTPCTFTFVVLNTTRSAGHKVKISSVTLLQKNISYSGHTVCTFRSKEHC